MKKQEILNMKKINKKGFLLAEETLKIVIAVICILFLVYLLVALYYSSINEKNLEFAKSSLQYLVKEINAGNNEIEVYNPESWVIISWPDGDTIPKTCSNAGWENCICICKGPFGQMFGIRSQKAYAGKCDDSNVGTCLEIGSKVVFKQGNYIKIKEPPLKLNIIE
jgi:hypothetical protein